MIQIKIAVDGVLIDWCKFIARTNNIPTDHLSECTMLDGVTRYLDISSYCIISLQQHFFGYFKKKKKKAVKASNRKFIILQIGSKRPTKHKRLAKCVEQGDMFYLMKLNY